MKFLRLVACVLSLCLLLGLCSCALVLQGGTTAQRVEAAMDRLDSYKADLELRMCFELAGVELEAVGTGVEVVWDSKDEFYYFTEITTEIKANGEKSAETVERKIYEDGNYYVYQSEDEARQALCSAATAEEIKALLEDTSVDFDLLNDAQQVQEETGENGEKILILSGYAPEAMESMVRLTGWERSLMDAELSDMKLTLRVDKRYRATEMKLEGIFTGEGTMPTLSVTVRYGGFNEAAKVEHDKASYKQVAYVQGLETVEKLMKERVDAESGSATLEIEQKALLAGQTQEIRETDRITYGTQNGAYSYSVDAEMNGERVKISYANGKQSIYAGGQTQKTDQEEAAAKAYVESLLSMQYDGANATGVEKKGEDQIVVTCKNQRIEAYFSVYDAMGGNVESITQTVTFTVREGKLIKAESEVSVKGQVKQGGSFYTMTMEVSSTLTYS